MSDMNIHEEREERIRGTLERMTLAEKVREMSAVTPLWKHVPMVPRYNLWTYDAGGCERLGVPKLRFTDGPRGVTVGRSTCFPVAMARGATFDAELEERIGDAIGYEARARGANFFGGVCINLLRHPGWGRAQETYGEDPRHLGVMGSALVRGVQRHAMACVKHFAMNSIEEARFFVDVRCSERTLHEIYLRHFKKCVEAGAAAVMSAYNKCFGDYCGHSRKLLTEVLKEQWCFDGFVVSDFVWGVRDGKAAALAGLDIEMPIARFYGKKLEELVERGEVPEEKIDDAVLRILRQKDRFKDVGEKSYDRSRIAGREHALLALEAARKSIVLLKNEGGVLPLARAELKTIAVIGKLARRANLGDMGSSRVRPPYAVTPLMGITERAGSAVEVLYAGGDDLDYARRIAGKADAVVVVAGLTSRQEGEYLPLPLVKFGGDRVDLGLPAGQEEMVRAVAAANPRCIVVLEGGSAIITESWKDLAPAILMAWYPGMEGGNAIADVIFGDVNPSGRLPCVFPKSADQLPAFDPRAREIEYGFYHGYRLLDREGQEPAFAFGHGLSYTTFAYDNLRVSPEEIGPEGEVKVNVDVSNTGMRPGEEVVQVYLSYRGSKVERPVRELVGFARAALSPGERKTVTVVVPAAELAYYNADERQWEVEAIEYDLAVGPSSSARDLVLHGSVRVTP